MSNSSPARESKRPAQNHEHCQHPKSFPSQRRVQAEEEEHIVEKPVFYMTPDGQLTTEKPQEIHPALEFLYVVITVLLGVVFLPVILAVLLAIVLIKAAFKYPFAVAAFLGLFGGLTIVVFALNLFFGGSPQ